MIDGRWAAFASLIVGLSVGCAGPSNVSLPDGDDVESYYESSAGFEAEVAGNVAVITVSQSPHQLRRGGSLWAKVGPYIYLFTEETYQLFEDYPTLAGVRVITQVGGVEVANALLVRDELSGVLWRRSLNIAGQARRDGTQRMTLLEDLVEWGEAHTEFEYNSRYTSR